MSLLDDKFKDLYSGYYKANSSLEHKRNLSADSTLAHILDVSKDAHWSRLLDVGAGNGSVLSRLDKAGIADELYAVEISESGVSSIRDLGLSTLKEAKLFDGYKIDFPDKFFDVAICIHVLEHVEHERLFLRELSRVAKELIVEVPLDGGIRISRSIREGYKFWSSQLLHRAASAVFARNRRFGNQAVYGNHFIGGLRKTSIRRTERHDQERNPTGCA